MINALACSEKSQVFSSEAADTSVRSPNLSSVTERNPETNTENPELISLHIKDSITRHKIIVLLSVTRLKK